MSAARAAIAAVRRLPTNRRDWAKAAAAAGIRSARASAVLDGGSGAVATVDGRADAGGVADPGSGIDTGGASETVSDAVSDSVITDPILAGALRVSAAIGELAAVWHRAPLQALARLHTLAAADLVDASQLGRPRRSPGVATRLAELAAAVMAQPWPGPVTVGVVHGELMALGAFEGANGVVARGAARLEMVASGLDPQALTAPEVGFLRLRTEYRQAAVGFASGEPDAVAAWLRHVCAGLEFGAKEARSVAMAMRGGS